MKYNWTKDQGNCLDSEVVKSYQVKTVSSDMSVTIVTKKEMLMYLNSTYVQLFIFYTIDKSCVHYPLSFVQAFNN